jgi:hypothetical protein
MVPMPAVVVLIVCKVALAGPPDQNAEQTHSENLKWATENSMMVCRRQEVQMYDRAEADGADPKPFTEQDCWRAGILMGSQWDAQHRNSPYRFWKIACPVPIVRKNPDGSENIIAWKLPDCGHRDTVRCEVDTAI